MSLVLEKHYIFTKSIIFVVVVMAVQIKLVQGEGLQLQNLYQVLTKRAGYTVYTVYISDREHRVCGTPNNEKKCQ